MLFPKIYTNDEIMMTLSLETLSAADFDARLGESFRIATHDGEIDLRLVAIRKLRQGSRAGGGFALDFVIAQGPHLPQGIYRLGNDTMNTLDMFLVPVGPVDGGLGYEAVFM